MSIETRVEKAVRLRLAYDKDNSRAKDWVDAEMALSDREFDNYKNAYAIAKGMKL